MTEDAPAPAASSSSFGWALAAGGAGVAALHLVAGPFLLPALRKHCLPYVAANRAQLELLEAACRRHNVRSVCDLGSGDGVVCVELAKRLNIRAKGVELNPWLVWYSRLSARRHGVAHLATFEVGDLFAEDVSDVDAVALFVVPAMMPDLEAKLGRELKEDAVVLAARFPLATWEPLAHEAHEERSRGYNVNQLWTYKMDPASRAMRNSG
mmetsp:Transcript_13028/g.38803  ORF Transcript_13028/g.38803 Transcript_13028/m.38803 type:complete len:210 (+) Transcript_13028:234-863(+)